MEEPTLDPQARVRAIFGDTVAVQPVKSAKADAPDESDADYVELITRVCYFYPQYTLETAQSLTHAQINALLIQADKQRALDYYNQVLIAAAPHSKKGKLVDKLLKKYKKITEQ